MELQHQFVVPVAVEHAWDVLLDLERIAPCMPGATLTDFSDDQFNGKVKVKVGPVQVTYNGTGKFTSKDPDSRTAVIEASGKEARGSGTAMATITAHLVADGAASTKVDVTTDLAITGRPAQFGRGVMVEVGNKLLGQFASCLADELGKPDSPVAAAVSGGAVDDEGPAPAAMVAPTSPPPETAAPVSGPSLSGTSASGASGASPSGPHGSAPEGGSAPTAAKANGDAAAAIGAAARTATAPSPAAARPTSDTIDLLDVAGPSVAKRLVPLAAAVAVLLVLWSIIRRRRD